MATSHATLAAGRWATLTLAEQLANVGSEVDRAVTAWGARRMDRFERALARALELFDLTAADPRCRGHRRREILRAREESCRLFFDDEVPSDAVRTLQKYFLQFALLARRPSA
jgi:S-adenosylmethionine:diacylglycerol 3-amino-3-carboxypropyl transferase